MEPTVHPYSIRRWLPGGELLRAYGALFGMICVLLVVGRLKPSFLSNANIGNVLRQSTVLIVVVDGRIHRCTGQIRSGYHDRLTSHGLSIPATRPTIIVQVGKIRVPAIKAALGQRIANALVTDENTARLILGD
jgi:hypothetical protein